MASQAAGIAPLTSELPLIAGSQLLFVQNAARDLDELTLKLIPSQNVLVQAVAEHFIEVIRNYKNISMYMQGKIVECTYSYLRDYGGHDAVKYFLNKRWIWLENRCEFVETKNVALQPKSNFSSNLEPFITILPVKYEQFHNLFEKFGVSKELTTQQILSVLNMIKKRSDVKVHVSPAQAWQIVIDILHWVADNSDVLKILLSKCLVIVDYKGWAMSLSHVRK